MKNWTRRDILKLSAVAPAAAGAILSPPFSDLLAASNPSSQPSQQAAAQAAASLRQRLLFDFGWRFHLGNANDPMQDFGYGVRSQFSKSDEFFPASHENLDDSQWREIDLPHDFAVELPFENERSLIGRGAKPLGRAYPATSIGWYRRVFEIPSEDLGKRISIEFDGVYRDSIIALNGHYVGRNLSGYAPFRFDVTDFLNYGGKNYLAVRADATESEGWFYEGAGIYRHVWLVKTNPLHVAQWGTYVVSEMRGDSATLTISTEVQNESDDAQTCRVSSTILDANGAQVGEARSDAVSIAARSRREIQQQVVVNRPALWSLEQPHLYRLGTSIQNSIGAVIDEYEMPFGIRTIRFDVDNGFFLNGEHIPIQGTCNHQDHAGVGSALPDRIQAFRVEKLKEMGANAYRTSHNPPTPELLDACDRLGMLVMDETRMMSSNPEGLGELERMIRRDRNHPCIILWSLGNEEPIQGTDRGERIASSMKRLVRRLDPTRPTTAAMNGSWGKGISNVLDVQGFNYLKLGSVDQFHAAFPAQATVGSEEASAFSTRGIYEKDEQRGYISAYDVNAPRYGTTAEEWVRYYSTRPFVAGAFVWTGFDYRGEPSPYSWPCISSHFGILDTCGFSKDTFYYYQSWWTQKPVLHIFPHWNWAGKEGQEISVWAHSNCEEVELMLNGKSLGKQSMTRLSHLEWKVPYAPGMISARGFRGGKVFAEARVETTGVAAGIRLAADRVEIRADAEDVSMIGVAVVDAQGRVVPIADHEVSFAVSGPGKIIGVGNGDPSSHEADKANQRRVFNGFAQVIVQSTRDAGEIQLTAQSPGLAQAILTMRAQAASARPFVS